MDALLVSSGQLDLVYSLHSWEDRAVKAMPAGCTHGYGTRLRVRMWPRLQPGPCPLITPTGNKDIDCVLVTLSVVTGNTLKESSSGHT